MAARTPYKHVLHARTLASPEAPARSLPVFLSPPPSSCYAPLKHVSEYASLAGGKTNPMNNFPKASEKHTKCGFSRWEEICKAGIPGTENGGQGEKNLLKKYMTARTCCPLPRPRLHDYHPLSLAHRPPPNAPLSDKQSGSVEPELSCKHALCIFCYENLSEITKNAKQNSKICKMQR